MPEEITDAIGTELLFENDRVLIWSMTIAPGEASPLHRHTRDWLYVYVTDDNTMETQYPSGRRSTAHFGDGFVGYYEVGDGDNPELIHALHNAGERTHRRILVEFKDAADRPGGEPQQADNGRREDHT